MFHSSLGQVRAQVPLGLIQQSAMGLLGREILFEIASLCPVFVSFDICFQESVHRDD